MRNISIKLVSLLLANIMILSGCANSESTTQENNVNDINMNTEILNLQDNDMTIGTSNTVTTNIVLNGDSIQCDNPSVNIDNSTITITSAGSYTITGTLDDGQIVVDCSKEDKVELILNNVNISCSNSSPIYVMSADKTIINLIDDSTNIINDNRSPKDDTTTSTDAPNGAIYSKDDLTIKGNGSLEVNANYNNGISTKNDLKITGGNITVQATNNAIKGNDSVTIKDGILNLTCDGDGIKTDNVEESDKGYIYIENGDITINSQGDCIQSDNYTTILDGTFDLTSADGYTNASAHTDDMQMDGGFGQHNGGKFNFNQNGDQSQDGSMPNMKDFNPEDMQIPEDGSMPDMKDFNPEDMQIPEDGSMPDMKDFNPEDMQIPEDGSMPDINNFNPNDENTYDDIQVQSSDTDNTTTEINSKTISSNGDLTIDGGTFNLNSQNDGLHSNANIIINAGIFTINAGDKGIHSDYDCNINGGNIDIKNSYEGIEGTNIYINDGNINIIASDDGFNASNHTETATGSNGFNVSSDAYLEFNGGYTYVKASGDGIDSNGDMVFNGGIIIVEGPTSGGDGPLDCGDNQNVIVVNGGTLLAGGSQQMFEIADSSSTQNYIYCLSLSAESGSTIVLADDDNNIICAMKTSQAMQSVMFSSSDIETGKTYHIYKDVDYDGTFDNNGFSTEGTFSNGIEVGSVEVTDSINQIGTGSVSNFGFGGRR